MNTSQLGNIGESRVLSEFVKLGVQCYLPYGDGSICDLIIDVNNRLYKIQIKTTEKLNKSGAMEWKITRQDGYHGSRVTYSLNDIDFFCLYCLETDNVCMIEFSNDFHTNTISIRPNDYAGNRLSTMRFASDYSIEKAVVKLRTSA